MTEEREQPEKAEEVAPASKHDDAEASENADKPAEKERLSLFKREKRNGVYISKLDEATLKKLQLHKSIYMYLSTLCYLLSMFVIPSEGRSKLMEAVENKLAYGLPLATLYLGVCIILFVLTVYIVIMNSTQQRITEELKERNVPRDGLDKHTYFSYELFNALHLLLAAGEIALTIYGFDLWGIFNIVVAVASAVLSFLSRQVLYKANAGNLTFVSAEEVEKLSASGSEKKNKKKNR